MTDALFRLAFVTKSQENILAQEWSGLTILPRTREDFLRSILVKVSFYGDGKPTWAVVLISRENPKRNAELVVARQADEGWETRSFDTTDGTPVVWREGPGKYQDLYGKKRFERGGRYCILRLGVMGGRLRLDGKGSRECPNFRLETWSKTATLWRILPSIVLETLAVAIAHKVVKS
jgi:hypothetical protein